MHDVEYELYELGKIRELCAKLPPDAKVKIHISLDRYDYECDEEDVSNGFAGKKYVKINMYDIESNVDDVFVEDGDLIIKAYV